MSEHTTESAADQLERLGMDGAKWAAEFRATALRLGYSDMDEGWLITWFCNAIMAGWDHAHGRPIQNGDHAEWLRDRAAIAKAEGPSPGETP